MCRVGQRLSFIYAVQGLSLSIWMRLWRELKKKLCYEKRRYESKRILFRGICCKIAHKTYIRYLYYNYHKSEFEFAIQYVLNSKLKYS